MGFGDDIERLVSVHKPRMAFTLGAMGSARQNFYNDAFRRGGFEDVAIESQRLWLEGRRDAAAACIPDEMILRANLLGTEEMVRERIRLYRGAGVNTLRLAPMGKDASERLDTLGRAVELIREET